MERNERLDEIMTCSKEAIAQAYMCREKFEADVDCLFLLCPIVRTPCNKITPQDWQEVLDGRD